MTKDIKNVPFFDDYQNSIAIQDLGACAGLVSSGYPLLHIDRSQGSKALFLFENADEIHEAIQMYWRDQLHVSALTYFNSLKNSKTRLYSETKYEV